MDVVKKLAMRARTGIILVLIAMLGVAQTPLHKTASGEYQTSILSQFFVLIGWIGIAILLFNLFRFINGRLKRAKK
jgi:hypothetical protein